MIKHRRAADGAWRRGLRRDLVAIARVAVPAFFLAYACAPTFRTAEAGGGEEYPVPAGAAVDCYPNVEPGDLLKERWRRVKSFDRLAAARNPRVELRRFDTLVCVDYSGASPREFPAGEWWWRAKR